LIYEPKLVYKVGFIREKGKATARAVQKPGNQRLAAQVKAGAFLDILTLGLGKG
jgi:hypothetical protein